MNKQEGRRVWSVFWVFRSGAWNQTPDYLTQKEAIAKFDEVYADPHVRQVSLRKLVRRAGNVDATIVLRSKRKP